MLTLEDRLERAKAIADARLGVAEQLSWGIGLLGAWAVYLKWDSLWLASAAGGAAIILVTHGYKREADKAWKAYTECPPAED